jgi:hypothetical protein
VPAVSDLCPIFEVLIWPARRTPDRGLVLRESLGSLSRKDGFEARSPHGIGGAPRRVGPVWRVATLRTVTLQVRGFLPLSLGKKAGVFVLPANTARYFDFLGRPRILPQLESSEE